MRYFLFFIGFLLSAISGANAKILPKIDTPENRQILQKVEQAYNKIQTIQANFTQFNSKTKNDLQTGVLYLSKPGKLRLVYEKGSPLEFYAYNGYLIYHDKEAKEVSYFELSQTPVELILRSQLHFQDPDFTVIDIVQHLDEYHVKAVKTDAPDLGSLTLVIDAETLALKKWIVKDMQKVESTVSLYKTQFNKPLAKELFYFKNPYAKKG